MGSYREYLDGLPEEARAALRGRQVDRARRRENAARRKRGEVRLPPLILRESANPLVETTCCRRRTSADMLTAIGDEFVCDRCRPR